MSDESNPNATTSGASFFVPTKWWQWVLVYPALATTVFGGGSKILDRLVSVAQDVPYNLVNEGQRQNDLWEKNASCIYDNPHVALAKQDKVEIDATICKTGDIALRRTAGDDKSDFRFVSWSDTQSAQGAAGLLNIALIASAYAQSKIIPSPPGTPTRICQRKIDNKTLLTRLQYPSGCVDEKINTYTGQLLERIDAPCSPTC